VDGIDKVVSGYAGGNTANPSYEEVCTGGTGHAEVVQLSFDPDKISFKEILHIFFMIHDPTTPNRQGADIGTQYRSAIFYHDEEQKIIAGEVIKELTDLRLWDRPIVTEIVPLSGFYPAEAYHQKYFEKNPQNPYCRIVIAPKLDKFRKHHPEKVGHK
jgi:peptide-methionine (S)-S-oxide reductase